MGLFCRSITPPSVRPECFLSSKNVSKGKSQKLIRKKYLIMYPSIHSPTLRYVEHSGRTGRGLFFAMAAFILLFFSQSLSATRWPFIIIIDVKKKSLGSSGRRVVRSRTSIKKLMIRDSAAGLFSDLSSFEEIMKEMNLSENALEELFNDAAQKCSTKVQVLLAQTNNDAGITEWRFTSPQGFILQLCNKKGNAKKAVTVANLVLIIKQGAVFWKGKRLEGILRIKSVAGFGEYNGTVYDGDFCITSHKNKFLCINCVCLEDYICAVLRTESWPGWPLEVNKAFAIACRSYVVFKLLEAQRSGRPFHVKNTNAHQTYHGKHDISLLKVAVEQTKSIILGFDGKPILAMFDSCCGGIIPAHINDFDFAKAPYLARKYACTYCKQCSLYSWQVSYEHSLFEDQLQHYRHDIALLKDIQITKKDKAGLAVEIKLKGTKNSVTLSGKKLYSLLKEIKSFHFDVQKKAGKIIFIGRGFGHHIGLCQWGARQMVSDGWDYKSILRFYYPGTYFMHLIE